MKERIFNNREDELPDGIDRKSYLRGIYEGWRRGLRSAEQWGGDEGNLAQSAVRDTCEVLMCQGVLRLEQVNAIREAFTTSFQDHASRRPPPVLPREGGMGEKNHRARLTPDQVVELRERGVNEGWTVKHLAAEYGVAATTISAIIRGEKWRHVGGPIRRTRARRRILDLKEILYLRECGLNWTDVAKRTGYNRKPLCRSVEKALGYLPKMGEKAVLPT